MSKKMVKYTDGDIDKFKLLDDFLPQPNELVKKHLEPALRADESVYVSVSAQDVINRNKGQ